MSLIVCKELTNIYIQTEQIYSLFLTNIFCYLNKINKHVKSNMYLKCEMLHLTECTQRIRTDGLCCHGRILRILSKWINRTNDLSDSICSTPESYLRPCVVAYQMDGIVPFHLEIPTLSSNLGRGDYIYQSHMAESIKYTMAKAPRWPRQALWGTRSPSWEKEPRKARIPNNFPEEEKTGKG